MSTARRSRRKNKYAVNYPKWRLECLDVTTPKIERAVSRKFKEPKRKVNRISVKRSSTPNWESGKDVWVQVSVAYIYVSWQNGRAYWLLCNIEPSKRPRIKASESTRTIWINTYGIRFERQVDFEMAKMCWLPFGRNQ